VYTGLFLTEFATECVFFFAIECQSVLTRASLL